MSQESDKAYVANLDLYEKLVATNPDIERKGAKMPYTSINGHMFSFLTQQAQVALRLPTVERNQFLEKYDTELCVQYGSVMKEYVLVPNALLKKTLELKEYFDVSYSYVSSLKPKQTRKRRKK